MTFKLIKYDFVKNITKLISEIPMVDFCCKGEEIYFVHDNGIGTIINGEIEYDWYEYLCSVSTPDLTTISSITYCSKSNRLYVVCEGGSQIGRIDLDMMEFSYLISKTSVKEFKSRFLQTLKSKTYIFVDNSKIFWSVRDCHRCFKIHGDSAVPLVGTGRSGYSISSLKNTKVCHPSGITGMNGVICFVDSGNKCLRGIGRNSTFNIIDNYDGLKDVHFYNEKFFFLIDKSIHMLSSEGDSKQKRNC
jgi:hypothetical protein